MSNTTLHWHLRKIGKHLKDEGRLNVLIMYFLHANERNRAWPSVETLSKETGFGRTTVIAAKDWLVDHGALEHVPVHLRVGKEAELHHRADVMQLTGILKIEDATYTILHRNEEQNADAYSSPREPKNGNQAQSMVHLPNYTFNSSPADTEVKDVVVDLDHDQFKDQQQRTSVVTSSAVLSSEIDSHVRAITDHPRLSYLITACDLLTDVPMKRLIRLAQDFGVDRVAEVGRWYCWMRDRKIARSGAWFYNAISQGWPAPEGWRDNMYLSESEQIARFTSGKYQDEIEY